MLYEIFCDMDTSTKLSHLFLLIFTGIFALQVYQQVVDFFYRKTGVSFETISASDIFIPFPIISACFGYNHTKTASSVEFNPSYFGMYLSDGEITEQKIKDWWDDVAVSPSKIVKSIIFHRKSAS